MNIFKRGSKIDLVKSKEENIQYTMNIKVLRVKDLNQLEQCVNNVTKNLPVRNIAIRKDVGDSYLIFICYLVRLDGKATPKTLGTLKLKIIVEKDLGIVVNKSNVFCNACIADGIDIGMVSGGGNLDKFKETMGLKTNVYAAFISYKEEIA